MTPSPAQTPVPAMTPDADEQLRAENAESSARLAEAEETLRAIRTGEVDALVVETADGPQVYSLASADAASNRLRGEILAQVSDSVIAVDPDQRVTYLNAAAERQYRVSASDVLGHQLSQIFSRQWPSAEAEAAMGAALREHGEWRGELTHRTHDAREIAVETSITALHDESGVLAGYVSVVRDITERKRSAEELQGVNLLLDTLLQTAPVGFCFLDRDLRYVRINERLALINGIPAEAHLGRHVSEIVPALDEPLRNVTSRILATGEAVLDHEFSGETPAAPGEMRFWNESWYPLLDGAGEVLGFGGIVEEITARKRAEAQLVNVNENLLVASLRQHELTEKAEWLTVQLQTDLTARMAAEEALRESQHFIHSVLYNLFAFVGVMTVDGTLTDANRSSLEAAGIPASEVLGKKFWDCYWWSYCPEVQTQLRDACERAAGGEVVRYDVPVRMADETRVWIDFQLSPLRDTKGRITHLIPSALEIQVRHAAEQALRESEAKYRSLFENMLDGFAYCQMLFDEHGQPHDFVYLAVNDAFGRLTGLENVIGKRVTQVIPGISELHPEMIETYGRVALAGNPELFEIDFKPWDQRLSISVYCPMKGYFVSVFDDITERKAAEQELLRHRENLERAVEQRTAELAASAVALHTSERLAALGTLAAGLGHDIANMTMPIRVRLQLLEAACTNDDTREDFAAISTSLDHLSNLSAGMRLMAMDPERGEGSTPAVDLEAWSAEISQMWRAALPRQIKLECQVQRGLGVNISRHRLAQAVFNLVQNAGEAMAAQRSGTIKIIAEAATNAAGAPVVRIEVSDDGPGMPAEVVARCFEPYFSTKGRAIATGMGLGMVRGIVETAGGTAAVRSAPGAGTTFTLTLPAAVSGQSADAGAPRTAAVTIKSQREASLAMMFLAQLKFKTYRHLESSAPYASLWVVEKPDPSLLRAYLDQHPLGRIIVLDGGMDSARADGGPPGTRSDAGFNDRSERMTVLSPSPSPADLRDAITRSSHASVVTTPAH